MRVRLRVRVRVRVKVRARVRVRLRLRVRIARLAGAREARERSGLDVRRVGVLGVEQRQAEEHVALASRLGGGEVMSGEVVRW